jgi:hypothetical protein
MTEYMTLCNQIMREKHRQRVVAMEKKVHELRMNKHREMTDALNDTFERVCQKYKKEGKGKEEEKEEKEGWVIKSVNEMTTLSLTINLSVIENTPLTFTHIL